MASRYDWPTLTFTRKEGATASLLLQPALPTSLSSSHVAFFDLLGWHLTPSITNDGALHFWGHGDEATAMAAREAYKLASP